MISNKKGMYVKEIDKATAFELIKKYHYSSQLPRLTKVCLGFFTKENEYVGALSLGWGTRPKHTIKILWDELESSDYWEIGKMALTDKMPRNSESQFLSLVVRYIKENHKNVKVLFTWADGILGKAGYVYQASNFLYGGFSVTDTYFSDKGERVHPRTSQKLQTDNGIKYGRRPTFEQLLEWGWKHYRGRQFKYIYFTCSRKMKKQLMNTCKIELSIGYPKDKDLKWKVKEGIGKWVAASIPNFNKKSTEIYDLKMNIEDRHARE